MTVSRRFAAWGLATAWLAPGVPGLAQSPPDAAGLMAAERAAMQDFSALDGAWRGQAVLIDAAGATRKLTQTARVGPMLAGSIKVIETRRYEADGRLVFDAMATISYDTSRPSFRLDSYAQGANGGYNIIPTTGGFVWEMATGPQAKIRYTAIVKDGEWYEVGDRVVGGQAPKRFFEMRMKRIGGTGWPAAEAIAPK